MTETINILVFSGTGVGQNCFPNTISILKNAKPYNGYTFQVDKTVTLNAAIMKGYDVIILPGGDGAESLYINNPNVNGKDLLTFVENGGGVVATCSGAYAVSHNVTGGPTYLGFNLAPGITSIVYAVDGLVDIEFTDEGNAIFNRAGSLQIDHEGGPAFVVNSGVVLATFINGDYNGYPAIVMDTPNEKGNVILFSPHPELTPQYPDMLCNAVINVYGGNNVTNIDISTSYDEIPLSNFKAMIVWVQNYITTHKSQSNPNPTQVFINSSQTGNYINFHTYLGMLTRYDAFYKANHRYPNQIAVNVVPTPPAPAVGSDLWVLSTIENRFNVTIKTKEDLYNLVIKEGVYAEYDNRKYSIIDAVNNYAWSSGINCADWVECIGNPVLRALGYRIGVDFWDIDGMVTCSDGTYGHYWITFNNSIPVQTWTASTNPNFFDLAGAAEEQRPQGTLICPEGECHIGDYQTDIPS
jgi:glutamine amidotransferase-like uncharacterized protein